MKSSKSLLIVLLALFISFSIQSISFAEIAPAKKAVPSKPAPQATVKKQVVPDTPKEPAPKEQVAEVKDGLCGCLKGAIEAIQKSYISLEEDEWQAAIKTTKDTINTINTLSKTCACPETVAYQKVAEAYLKYAEGGNHLDGAEEPNCPFATKLYSDAIVLLDAYIPKISNAVIKENAEDIRGYVKEEKEFVDEECSGAGAKTKEKSTGAGESKDKEKKQ